MFTEPNARTAVRSAVEAGMKDLAVLAGGPAPRLVPPAAERVLDELMPTLEHLANDEVWWRSRVTLGSIATILTSAGGLYAMIAAGISDGEALAAPIGAILGACFALYGRWAATKPLGK